MHRIKTSSSFNEVPSCLVNVIMFDDKFYIYKCQDQNLLYIWNKDFSFFKYDQFAIMNEYRVANLLKRLITKQLCTLIVVALLHLLFKCIKVHLIYAQKKCSPLFTQCSITKGYISTRLNNLFGTYCTTISLK